MGSPWNEAEQCWEERTVAACLDALPDLCGTALTYARSRDGTCWLFYDTCIPPGYEGGLVSHCMNDNAPSPSCSQ